MEIQRTDNPTEKAEARQRINRNARADLLTEQAALIERLCEITAALSGSDAPLPKPAKTVRKWPDDFNLQAYAIGLIWCDQDISVRQLAKKLGVSHATFRHAAWAPVRSLLKARTSSTFIKQQPEDCAEDDSDDE
jgi:hypothetical protein